MAKDDQAKLKDIKDDIENSYKFFQDNYKRFHEFHSFVFKTSLSPADIERLKLLQKPTIEFPILEAYISRLRGEFAKQKPEITIRAADGIALGKLTRQYLQTLKVLQAHISEIIFEASNDQFEYNVYSDTLAGGFSAAKVFVDWVNEKSFLQKIKISRVYNPTMCGWDPLARESHKGDGRYCFEMYPMTEDEFIAEFGEEAAKDITFSRTIQDFHWSFKNNDQKIVLVVDYYVKVQSKRKLYKLSDGQVKLDTEYKQMLEEWDAIEVPPVPVDERETQITTIDRYQVCQTKVLNHEETIYPMLPIIFIDGNSVMLQNDQGGQMQQFCKPYVYHAKGIQRLKNFAGQTLGSSIEDIVAHNFMIPIEGIPLQYKHVYDRPQVGATLVYHQFDSKTKERLDPPREIQKMPTPPVVENTFMQSDPTAQAILGSYDAILGISDKEVSGKAIQQGAMQSNAAAIPYLMGYIKGIERCVEVILHLIPLIYVTPRSIPVRLPDGKLDYVIINENMGNNQQPNVEQQEMGEEPQQDYAIMMNYDPHDFNVKVEPGVNVEIQKQLGMEQLIELMNISPVFAEFMNSQGLPILLDNISIRGIEGLKEMAETFIAQKQQTPPQPSDVEIEAQTVLQVEQMKTEQRAHETEGNLAIQAAKIAVEKERAETERLEAFAKLGLEVDKQRLEKERIDSENTRSAIEDMINFSQMLQKDEKTND